MEIAKDQRQVRPVRVLGGGGSYFDVELSDEVWNRFIKRETRWLSFIAKDELDAYKQASAWLERWNINDQS